MEQVQGELQTDCLHVGPLEGRGDVHVHVQEPVEGGVQGPGGPALPAHGAPVLGLLDLQLGEQLDEPLEALLVPVDPEEVNLWEYLR